MPRPKPRRAIARVASAAALAALAACAQRAGPGCPGDALAELAFDAALAPLGVTTLAAGLDPVPGLPDCASQAAFPAAVSFSGILTSRPSGDGALCRGNGAVMGGSRSGDRWSLLSDTNGAVLGGCAPTCTVRSRETLVGDVTPSAAAVAGFTGALVEELLPDAGECGPCALPCAARYTLTGTRVNP